MIRAVMLPALRWWARVLTTEHQRPPAASKFVRAILFVPVFSVAYGILRIRLALLGPVHVTARTRAGAQIKCALPDMIQLYIYLFGVWEPDLSAWLESNLAGDRMLVDVGANIGYDALIGAARLTGAHRVVAIDASPAIVERLRANLAANGADTTVRVVTAAVSDEVGELKVFSGPQHNSGLTTTVAGRKAGEGETVPAAPLSFYLEADELRRVRVIKIDVEGAEPAVLRGIVPLLDDLPDDLEIAVELSPLWWGEAGHTAESLLSPFIEAGFRLSEIENNYWPWRYLWPHAVSPPRPARRPVPSNVKRVDLILSRYAEQSQS